MLGDEELLEELWELLGDDAEDLLLPLLEGGVALDWLEELTLLMEERLEEDETNELRELFELEEALPAPLLFEEED